ncbi:MAG: serine/threonine protein kinase, partial [bacterium]
MILREKNRFMREARAAAAQDHPNIAAVHEIADYEGETFIVLAYVEGETLKKKIKSGPLPVEQALDIAIQIAQGLKEAHDHGIVHRDITSTNIMVTPKGQVKITDFGLAKFKGEKTLTKSEAQMGTAGYMSPEQIQGEAVDHQGDIFSFGVVLYEMLTGQLPFKGEDDHAQIFSIVYDTPQAVRELNPSVPEELEHILESTLAKDKEFRYQSIDELLADLHSVKENITSGQMVPLSRRARKRKKISKVLIPVALAVSLIVAFVLFRLVFHERALVSTPRP